MARVRIDYKECMVCHMEKCVIFPKYVLRVLSLLDYCAYDVDVFVEKVERLRRELAKSSYNRWPEWIKTNVPKRYAKSFLNHLLWIDELR